MREVAQVLPLGDTGEANMVNKYERAKVKCASLAVTLWNNKMRLKGAKLAKARKLCYKARIRVEKGYLTL